MAEPAPTTTRFEIADNSTSEVFPAGGDLVADGFQVGDKFWVLSNGKGMYANGIIVTPTGVHVGNEFEMSNNDSPVAILSGGDVISTNQAHVDGLIYAHSETGTAKVELRNDSWVFGSIIADKIICTNKLGMFYDPRLQNLTGLPGGEGDSLRIVSWEDM